MHLAPIITILTIYQIDFRVFGSLKEEEWKGIDNDKIHAWIFEKKEENFQ